MRIKHVTILRIALTLLIALPATHAVSAADWPTWGGNAARTAAVTSALPENLHLQWTLQLREPDPAWHSNQDRVQFDRMYEPVVAGKRMFVGSMVNDRVTAYHTDRGEELWRFYPEGPVRLAPTVWEEKVYFACDDGHLYCLNAADGSLVWKFNGGPLERRVLGNERLISIFPARGAPVVYDGTVYFAAGIWPFMGTFIQALDTETGEVVWTNSGTGSMYILQQHDRPAFAGVAPQGYLVATENILLVSGGQTVPAAFDRHTGEFLHFNVNSREMGAKGGSGYHVRATADFFVTNEYMFRMSDGAYLARLDYPIITDHSLISIGRDGTLRAYEHDMIIEKTKDRKGRATVRATLRERWSAELDENLERLHLMAGSRAIATGAEGLIAAVELSEQQGDPRITWTTRVQGDPLSVIAADDRLFVATDHGSIHCFAAAPPANGQPVVIDETGAESFEIITAEDEWQRHVQALLSQTSQTKGHCLLLGIGSGRLLDELLAQSDLHVIALDPDADKVAYHRQRLDAAGLYGSRVEVFSGDVFSVQLPPCIACLIVSEDGEAAGLDRGEEFVSRMFESLRPYGGVACLPAAKEREKLLEQFASDGNPHNALLKRSADGLRLLLSREGPLPGSAPWTHQYADAGNSVMSQDGLVKAPLGILWFGGPSNERVLPRHGHGPTPQVAGGRLFIEGRDMLRAVDVYTGRLLWERDFPDVGQYYDYTSHEPGANAIGSNYVSLEDSVYLIHEDICYRLDAETGETLAEFTVPPAAGEKRAPEWGRLSAGTDWRPDSRGHSGTEIRTRVAQLSWFTRRNHAWTRRWQADERLFCGFDWA